MKIRDFFGFSKITTLESLTRLNTTAGIAHLTAFVVFGVLFALFLKNQYKSIDVVRLGAEEPPAGEPRDSTNFPIVVKKVFTFKVTWIILAFFACSFLFHFIYATNRFGYFEYLKEGWNPIRWVEYAISASIMVLIIAGLVGIRDITSLFPIFTLVAGVQGMGYLVERNLLSTFVDGASIKAATGIAWALLLGAWIPIAYNLASVIRDVRRFNSKVPAWVPWLVIVQFFQFSQFGFVQAKQVKDVLRGVAVNFLDIEKKYIVLSLQAKLALACFIAYGLFQRQRADNED